MRVVESENAVDRRSDRDGHGDGRCELFDLKLGTREKLYIFLYARGIHSGKQRNHKQNICITRFWLCCFMVEMEVCLVHRCAAVYVDVRSVSLITDGIRKPGVVPLEGRTFQWARVRAFSIHVFARVVWVIYYN